LPARAQAPAPAPQAAPAASGSPAPAAPAPAPAAGAQPAAAPAGEAGASAGFGSDWETWRPNNSVTDLASLQRGARNFFAYCNGCHSLRFERYARLGLDLEIPTALLQKDLLPGNRKLTDYIATAMPTQDAENWFGKAPPDASLLARSRGTAYLYQYLLTYCVDSSRPTGANNLAYPNTAMPDVLSDQEGLKRCVYRTEEMRSGDGSVLKQQVFDHFETVVPGALSHEEYAQFVRDIVNFLDYVAEPQQAFRRSLGVWVVLFLLVFTGLAWLLKREYWKDVH
jgi:ubiquinol-cytochrome c reductase cytochrome c1 subunit